MVVVVAVVEAVVMAGVVVQAVVAIRLRMSGGELG